MSFESSPRGEQDGPVPRVRLAEGSDFLDFGELHGRVAYEISQRGHSLQTVLLCGHNQDTNNGEPRMQTYALSLAETTAALTYSSRSPYDEAVGTADMSDRTPTITVYDAQRMQPSMEHAGQYETLDGTPVDTAVILEFELSMWE